MYVLVLSDFESLAKYDILGSENQFTYEFYDINKYHNFTDFVSRTKAIYSFESIIIDTSTTVFSHDDIIKGITLFKQFFSTKIVFVLKMESELHNTLVGCEVYNLVDTNSNSFEKDLKQSLLDDEIVFKNSITKKANNVIDTVIRFIRPNININKDFPIKIGVIGAFSRVGTTTIAMSIINYLKYANISTCYVDIKGEHIAKFTKLYEHIDNDDGHVVINDIAMTSHSENKWNISVVDCGIDISLLEDCDVKLLCSTSKLWELPQTAKTYQKLSDVHMLFNLSNQDDEDKIKNIWSENIEFFPYCTNLWNCENSGFWNMFLKPILEEL